MKIAITPPKNPTFRLRSERKNAIIFLHCFLVRDASVMGFMSGGMVADTASEGFCNYLSSQRGKTLLVNVATRMLPNKCAMEKCET